MGTAADVEARKIPAAFSRRRSRVVVTAALAATVVLLIVPALILRPMRDPTILSSVLGVVIGLGLSALRDISNARGQGRLLTKTDRYLSAPTWTGMRTIDLCDLRSVRARRITGQAGISTTYVVVVDGEGVRMSFSKRTDIARIRQAVTGQLAREDAPQVRVSRFAAAALGLRPLPGPVSALWSMGSVGALVTVTLAAVGTISVIAGS